MKEEQPPSDVDRRTEALSSAKRALLEQRLREVPDSGFAERSRSSPAPLSAAQERVWLLSRLHPDSVAYHTAEVRRIRGPLDIDALQRAFDALAARHEALRTTFPEADGQPVQDVQDPAPVPVRHVDGTSWRPDDRLAAAESAFREEVARPFDLTRDPPLRVTLIAFEPDEHILVIVLHHIASDGWSKAVLLTDLASLYAAFVRGTSVKLPALPVQPSDYAEWERAQDHSADLEYWEGTLRGAPPGTELPPDRPRPAVKGSRGARYEVGLGPELLTRARAFARSRSSTLFITLLAGFEVLLSRYTGEEDLVVGTPVAGRGRAELEDVIGYFGNTLALRLDASADPTFDDLVARVHGVVRDGYAHQHLPFQRLVERLQPERDPSRSPLFQILFTLQNPSLFNAGLPGLDDRPLRFDPGWSRFDLTFGLGEERDELVAICEYDTELFDRETIEALVERYRTVLEWALGSPGDPISGLSLVTPDERQTLLSVWNDTSRTFPAGCLHEIFEAQARRTPDLVAASTGDEAVTYSELQRWSNAVARQLIALGVQPGENVALCARRAPGMLAALLGIMKAGAAYVPLDPSYPAERLDYTLADSGARVLVANRREAEALTSPPEKVLWIDEPHRADSAPEVEIAPDAAAYVMYTSGSTGRPKGVVVEHRGVVNVINAMTRLLDFGEGDTLVSVTSLAFDVSLPDWFMPLSTGGSVAIARRHESTSPDALGALIDRSGAKLMQATPATWRMLLDGGWQAPPGFTAASGGDVLPRALADALLRQVDVLWNFYGPTEATIWATAEAVEAGAGSVPLGRPLDNTTCYVLDQRGALVPPGAVGEIWLGGAGVARGYLGRPDLTSDRFVRDPFSLGGRMYRTGDLGRHRRDGKLEFLGRVDNQVKVRGHRIELGEIEAVLAERPDIAEAAAAVREDAPGHPRIVAYVVPKPGATLTGAELKATAARKLPEYMRPTALVTLPSLPLTHNGKLDRRALPPPDEAHFRSHTDWVAPRTPLEEHLASTFMAVTAAERVGAFDDFFDLGANSLLLTQFVLRVREETGIDLPPLAPFEAPTVAGLAEVAAAILLEEAGDEEIDAVLAELDADGPQPG